MYFFMHVDLSEAQLTSTDVEPPFVKTWIAGSFTVSSGSGCEITFAFCSCQGADRARDYFQGRSPELGGPLGGTLQSCVR